MNDVGLLPEVPLVRRASTRVKLDTDTLVLSDVHLGLPACRAAPLLDTLKGWRFRRLVLLGDIFHDLDFRRLNADHWDFLSHVRKLSNPKRGVEVVWVLGNHDRKAAQVASHLMGVAVHERYAWEQDGRRYLAIHGDSFDRLLTRHPILTDLGGRLLGTSQRLLRVGRGGRRWIGRSNPRRGLTTKVRQGALALALDERIDVIFCGHTHEALHEREVVEGTTVEYVNTGCWTRLPSHLATVDGGGVRLHAYR
ncbi:MAG: UDP-2,3-diacylglucosamine diphosphatase [Pseudomonadota bacterium]